MGDTTLSKKQSMSWLGQTLLYLNLILALLLIIAKFYFGSVSSGINYLHGDRLFVDYSTKSIGMVERGQIGKVSYLIRNTSRRSITITGAAVSCGCVITTALPVTLSPGSKIAFPVTIDTSTKHDTIKERLTIFTNYGAQPQMSLQLVGDVSINNAIQPSQ